LHAVDLALQCFDRIVGLRDGKMVFDLPAHQVTPAMLKDLYANESQINTAPYKPGSDITDTVAARLM